MTIKKNILLFSTALILLASSSVVADEVTEPSLVASPVSKQEAQPPTSEPVSPSVDTTSSNPSKELTETSKIYLLSTILKTAWGFIKSWF